MFGASAGASDLTGMTNAQVAAFYSELFSRQRKEAAALGLGGPLKLEAQVMAVAFAVYVTNATLAGTTAAAYGFVVTDTGVGTATFDVASSGAAFGVANGTRMTVLDLLLAVDARSRNGVLYDLDGDGDANDCREARLRTMANVVFTAINEQGDCGGGSGGCPSHDGGHGKPGHGDSHGDSHGGGSHNGHQDGHGKRGHGKSSDPWHDADKRDDDGRHGRNKYGYGGWGWGSGSHGWRS